MDTLTQDVRYACRSLLKHPGLSAVILMTLTLGIGANTTVFSFVYGMMLRPLGYPEEERLVNICDVCPAEGESCSTVSIPDFVDWQEQSSSFADMGICATANVNLVGGDHPEDVPNGAWYAYKVSVDKGGYMAFPYGATNAVYSTDVENIGSILKCEITDVDEMN